MVQYSLRYVQGVRELVLLLQSLIARHIGGDISARNLSLANRFVDLLIHQKQWLISQESLCVAVFTYLLRAMSDHKHPKLSTLRAKEAKLAVDLWEQRPDVCARAGGEFVRLLWTVQDITELQPLWQRISSSTDAAAGPTLVSLLCEMPPDDLLAHRLPPSIERQLKYMLNTANPANMRRYQAWFVQR